MRSYAVANGGRVAKNGTVAEVFPSEEAAAARVKDDKLKKQIENLEMLQRQDDNIVVDLDQLNTQIDSSLIRLLDNTQSGSFEHFSEDAEDYFNLLNRKLIATGKTSNFSELIQSLEEERSTLTSLLSDGTRTIQAKEAGYFVSSVDGYESVLTPDIIDGLTPEKLGSIKPKTTEDTAQIVGKTVGDFDWYLAVPLTFEQSLSLKEGQSLSLKLPLSTLSELPVTVERINKSAETGEAVVVFRCSYMNGELSLIRTQPVQIVLESHKGLRVDTESIRVEDGKKGVYRVTGSEIEFVPVNILFSGNGFVICEMMDTLEDGLHLYDEVVTKGKDLYDHKVVR